MLQKKPLSVLDLIFLDFRKEKKMNKAFDNFAWKNYPNISTPLEKEFLNKINNGLDAVDDRVVTYDTTKFNTSEAQLLVKNVELNEDSGVLKIIHYNGSVSTYSSLLGKVAVNFDFDEESQKMIIYLSGGDRKEVDLSAFITDYEFVDTETIGFQTSADGKVSAIVKEGSIQEKHLRPDYLANVRSEVSKAESASRNADTAAAEAGSNATLSRSWAVGDTGARPGENTDNSKYYYQQSKSIYDNFSQAGTVTGVKGNAETTYRTGNVNLTAANVGAVNKGGDTMPGRLNFSGYGEIRFITPDVTGGHARGMFFMDKNGTDTWGGIGVYGSAGILQGIYIGAGTVYPWDSSYGLRISDTHIKWKNSNLVTENSGTAKEAVKATQDGNGNNIVNTYAKKSNYGDDEINVGRKAGTKVGNYSSAFGADAVASGDFSLAEGINTIASGECSHAEGDETKAQNYASHAAGKYNKDMSSGGNWDNQTGDAFVVGNGTGNGFSNAFRVTYRGEIYGTKAFQSSGADYAEFIKPWADGNLDHEDRVGYFVTVKDGFLYKANEGDFIVGITSGNPSIVGNADEDYYWRYERDEFNRIVLEDVPETVQKTDKEGNLVFDEKTHRPVMIETGKSIPNARMKLNPDYNPELQKKYIERKDRKEWEYVGMLGVLPIRDDGTCQPGQFCKCGIDGIATFTQERGFDTYMVLERISDNIVSVILK